MAGTYRKRSGFRRAMDVLVSVVLIAAAFCFLWLATWIVVSHFHYTEYSETKGAYDEFDMARSFRYYGPFAVIPAVFGVALLLFEFGLRRYRKFGDASRSDNAE